MNTDYIGKISKELEELSEKGVKLETFLSSESNIDPRQINLLKLQHHFMKGYAEVLRQRLSLLKIQEVSHQN